MTTETTYFEEVLLRGLDFYDFLTDKEKAKLIYDTFLEEFAEQNNSNKDTKKLFREWLMTYPKILELPTESSEILLDARENGFILREEYQEQNFLNMYFHNLTKAFFNLKNS